MNSNIFLVNFFINLIFLLLTFSKVGLKNKTYFLPSTIFAAMWAWTSLGVWLFSNGVFDNIYAQYYVGASNLKEIGEYQFMIFVFIYAAIFIARIQYSNLHTKSFRPIGSSINIDKVLHSFKWVLWLYFLIGLYRLFLIVTTVGFNYALIRDLYISTRETYSAFDVWLVRIGSYLMYAAYFYVALEGVKAALHGINFKHVLVIFLMYAPFQMSFGGRLFIISFFIPFMVSYFVVRVLSSNSRSYSSDNRKLLIMVFSILFMVVSIAILKQGLDVNTSSLKEYSSDLFYTVSSYRFLNELWYELPSFHDYGWGAYIFGLKSDFLDNVIDDWYAVGNNAVIATPSMLPDMILDFGMTGSLFVYFVFFYCIESLSYKLLNKPSIKSLLIFLLLCAFCFSSSTSSMSNMIKSLIIGGLLVFVITKYILPAPKR